MIRLSEGTNQRTGWQDRGGGGGRGKGGIEQGLVRGKVDSMSKIDLMEEKYYWPAKCAIIHFCLVKWISTSTRSNGN